MTLATPETDYPDLSGLVHDHDDTAGDVGTELLDLPDDLVLPDPGGEGDAFGAYDEAFPLEMFAAPWSAALSVSASTAAAWTQYEWMSWAADELRAAGLNVIEHPGWKTRGRPRSVGRYQPRGLMIHHDASAKGPSPYVAKFLAEVGRPNEGIYAPLSPFWVCMGCNKAHVVGTWHVLAAGRCNHAGTGAGWGAVGEDAGNAVLAGVETDNTVGEATPPEMLASLVKGSSALMKRMRSDPRTLLCAHREYTDRKNDPDDINMPAFRLAVAREMAGTTKPPAKAERTSVRYIVKKADTLAKIGAYYKASPSNLYKLNKAVIDQQAKAHKKTPSASRTAVYPGMVLTVPWGQPGQSGSPAEKAQAAKR
jgi:LysM repeat protein